MKHIATMKEEVKQSQMKVFEEQIVPYIEQLVIKSIAKGNFGVILPEQLLEKMLELEFVQDDIRKEFEDCGFTVDEDAKYYYLSWVDS